MMVIHPDLTITLFAPSSTKNEIGKREREMYQTKKGNQWHFGMKIHIDIDDTLGLIHSIDTMAAANIHDVVPTSKLLYGEDQRVFGDAGYLGVQKPDEHKGLKNVSWLIAKRTAWHQQELRCLQAESRRNQTQYPCQDGAYVPVH